jgi:positive regulator of sigma E activity
MREQDLLRTWQQQPMVISPISIEQVQVKVLAFQRRTRIGYVLELIAAILVLLGYGAVVWSFPNLWVKVGSALIILAGFFIFYQFHKRWNARVPPENLGTQILQFHKQELIRRRDMLRSSWVWYISPLVPGMLIYWLGMLQANPQNPFNIIGIVICFATFFGVGLFNEWRARRVQRQIDSLYSSAKEIR